MSIVDRIVYRFIHRNKHGEAGRAHDEVGGAHHAHAGHAHAGHGSVGQGHGADDDGPHEHGDLTEPGRFSGEHAERYAKRSRSWSRHRFYRRIARDVAQLAPQGGLVLDIGTGPGALVAEIARARPDVRLAGVDVEAAMVRLAEELVAEAGFGARVQLHVADVARLPFEEASVDVVVASLTAHHWPDVRAAVGELARVLRPGGVLLVVDFASAVEGPLREAVAELFPGAAASRQTRWAWGLPALVSWRVRIPLA